MKIYENRLDTGSMSALRRALDRRWLSMVIVLAFLAASTGNAFAATTITGTVGATGKFLVTGAPVTTTTAAVLKISFGNDTARTNLALCAGTIADFVSNHCALQLSDSGARLHISDHC